MSNVPEVTNKSDKKISGKSPTVRSRFVIEKVDMNEMISPDEDRNYLMTRGMKCRGSVVSLAASEHVNSAQSTPARVQSPSCFVEYDADTSSGVADLDESVNNLAVPCLRIQTALQSESNVPADKVRIIESETEQQELGTSNEEQVGNGYSGPNYSEPDDVMNRQELQDHQEQQADFLHQLNTEFEERCRISTESEEESVESGDSSSSEQSFQVILQNGQSVARFQADPTGQAVIVPMPMFQNQSLTQPPTPRYFAETEFFGDGNAPVLQPAMPQYQMPYMVPVNHCLPELMVQPNGHVVAVNPQPVQYNPAVAMYQEQFKNSAGYHPTVAANGAYFPAGVGEVYPSCQEPPAGNLLHQWFPAMAGSGAPAYRGALACPVAPEIPQHNGPAIINSVNARPPQPLAEVNDVESIVFEPSSKNSGTSTPVEDKRMTFDCKEQRMDDENHACWGIMPDHACWVGMPEWFMHPKDRVEEKEILTKFMMRKSEIPDWDRDSKLHSFCFDIPAEKIICRRPYGYVLGPEFAMKGIAWSLIVYPQNFYPQGMEGESEYMDVKIQIKYYDKNPKRGLKFKVKLMHRLTKQQLAGDSAIQATDRDEDYEMFSSGETGVYRLFDRPERLEDESGTLTLEKFANYKYVKTLFNKTRILRFHVEVEDTLELSPQDKLNKFLRWVMSEVSHDSAADDYKRKAKNVFMNQNKQRNLNESELHEKIVEHLGTVRSAEEKFRQLPYKYYQLAQTCKLIIKQWELKASGQQISMHLHKFDQEYQKALEEVQVLTKDVYDRSIRDRNFEGRG